MQLGAVTYHVLENFDLETILKMLEGAGYAAVELRSGHKHGVERTLDAGARRAIKERFARSKVRLLSFGTMCEFQSPDAAVRRRNVEEGKTWVDMAHDTGAWGLRVRPNGFAKELSREANIANIAACLRELGDYAKGRGVEIWMELHGEETLRPEVAVAIMKATGHPSVGLYWNSNPEDVVSGSVRESWDLVRSWMKCVHLRELADGYPYRELFALMRKTRWEGYTMCLCDESKEPERFLKYYRALWVELNRP